MNERTGCVASSCAAKSRRNRSIANVRGAGADRRATRAVLSHRRYRPTPGTRRRPRRGSAKACGLRIPAENVGENDRLETDVEALADVTACCLLTVANNCTASSNRARVVWLVWLVQLSSSRWPRWPCGVSPVCVANALEATITVRTTHVGTRRAHDACRRSHRTVQSRDVATWARRAPPFDHPPFEHECVSRIASTSRAQRMSAKTTNSE